MKHKIQTYILLLALAVGGIVAIVAGDAVSAACENGADGVSLGEANEGDCAKTTSFRFSSCGSQDVGISCLVKEVLTFASGLVGIAVVGGIIWGGIVYSTASGSPANTQKGRKIIGNAILGLVLYLLMFAIVQFLVPNSPLQQ